MNLEHRRRRPPAPGLGSAARKAALVTAGLVAVAALALGGCGRQPDVYEGRKIVRVWHVWGGTMAEGFNKICETYQKEHPNIDLRPVFAANDLATNQKFFTAVAAHRPPEVIFVDGPQVASWAEWGALTPLTDRMKKAGITADDYFPPCWRQTHYNHQAWALTFCADPNFGFAWNKELFRKAGLNPDKPPVTIAEMDKDARVLTRQQDGDIVQIGLIPWAQYGSANSIFTWGWDFGGNFFDYKDNKITCDNPRLVAALKWMTTYAKEYGVTNIASLSQTFGSAAQNPFITGKVAMECLHIGGIADLHRYAPNLDYGVTYLPYPPGGSKHSSWVGGWCVAVPKGAENVQQGWDFVHWLCATPEGTKLMGEETGLFPGYRKSPYFREVLHRKYYSDFYRILLECRHQRPVMPVQASYMRALGRAVDAAVYGEQTPEQALKHAQVSTQRELDLVLRGRASAPGRSGVEDLAALPLSRLPR